jgi:hypothetical protein
VQQAVTAAVCIADNDHTLTIRKLSNSTTP